jgi:hypothetical protein
MTKMLLLEIGLFFILNLAEVAEMINLPTILLIILDSAVNKLVSKLRNQNIFLSTQRIEKLEYQDSLIIIAGNKEIGGKLLLNA